MIPLEPNSSFNHPAENKNRDKKDTSKLSGAPSILEQMRFDPNHPSTPNLNFDQVENKNNAAKEAPKFAAPPPMDQMGFINPSQQQIQSPNLIEWEMLKREKQTLLSKIEREEKVIKEQAEVIIALRDKTLGLILELADDAANDRKADKKKVIICEYLKDFWKEQGLWKKVILNVKGGMHNV